MGKRRNGTRQRLIRQIAAERAADRREAAQLLRVIAKPTERREQIKNWITRAASEVNFERARTEDIWRMEARRIDAWEMDALRNAVRARRRAVK